MLCTTLTSLPMTCVLSLLMSTLIGLILCLPAAHGITISLCTDNTYLEVKEGRDDNRFVCTGLTAQQTVNWFWGQTFILACTPSSCDVNYYYPTYFKISRPLATESDITLNVTTFSNLDISRIGSLTCQVTNDNKETCELDVVYPAENAKCQIQFSGDTWELTGWCNVSKVRSRRDRYGCNLYETLEKSSILVGSFQMSRKSTSEANYFSGVCEIKTALPQDGNHSYSVIITPGEVLVIPSFSGSNEIRRPTEPPKHNCPQNITEGEDLNCSCYSQNLGLPPGFPVWKGSNSSKLMITKVNRAYNGQNNTCSLMWNNIDVESVIYSITVNFASKVLIFTIDNKADSIVNVSENSNVSIVCEAEGRPLPTIRLFQRTSDNQDLQLALANNTQKLQLTMTYIKCEATASYFCKSENSILSHQIYRELFVKCSPKRTSNDTYVTTFENDQARLEFEIIAYPSPDLLSIFYITSANISIYEKVEHKNTATSTCSPDKVYRYMITCAVTLHNETAYAPGFYSVTFGNVQGNLTFTFEVKEKIQTTTESMDQKGDSQISGPGSNVGGIIGGVIGGVVLIALTVVIIIFIVRRKKNYSRDTSLSIKTEEDFSEQQSNEAETQQEANVEEKGSKQTTDSTTDVYAAVVKKTPERKEIDSTASTLSPTPEDASADKKEKLKFVKSPPGKVKKKGKEGKKPVAAKNTGPKSGAGALSMSPITESEYQNLGFEEEHEKNKKGANEIQRRNQQGLNYTTVVFDNISSRPPPPSTSDSTVYAEIVPQKNS